LSYRLAYTQRAVKDIGRLDANVKKRIGNTLLRFIDNPLQYAEPLTDSALGSYRFRIGDYRVIFDIEGNDVVVLRVGHRKDIYKRK
jgi:mRNA interferase RelE/StbE